MVRLRTKSAWLAVGALAAAAFIIWPGCVSAPLPSSRHPLSAFKPVDFKFAKNAHPTRGEIVAKVGEPDQYFPDLHVACYRLNRLTRGRLILLFGLLPVGGFKDNDRLEVAMIEYDAQDRAKRIKVKAVGESAYLFAETSSVINLRHYAKEWLTTPPKDARKSKNSP
jgi:hypothetical protein